MSSIILPKTNEGGKPYLSYGQIDLWLRSKREYIRRYFFGEKFHGNSFTIFGNLVGESLEHNDYTSFTVEEQEFLSHIIRYDEFERRIVWDLGEFEVVGYVDTNTAPGNNGVERVIDYKTGEIDKQRDYYASDDYLQLVIYAGALYQEFGVPPKSCVIALIGREGNPWKRNDPLRLTLEVEYIEKNITRTRIKEVEDLIRKVAEEISQYYKIYLKLNKI